MQSERTHKISKKNWLNELSKGRLGLYLGTFVGLDDIIKFKPTDYSLEEF